jgi:hypothetical protein
MRSRLRPDRFATRVTLQSPPPPAPLSEDGDGDGSDDGHDLLRLQLIEKVNVLKRLLTELVLPGHPLDELIDKLGGSLMRILSLCRENTFHFILIE